jgi:hypothetical protein
MKIVMRKLPRQQAQLEILILSWIFHDPLINPVLDSSSHYFGINPLLLPL